jgi:hypothetical protein|tara:strand:+ start:829 stop:1293 length:465 start_codon:yes stop_codon:yes gene_type:complete
MLDNNLIEVENFLPDALVDSLVEFSQGDVPWETQEMQERLSRRKVNFILDTPIETTHNWFSKLPMFAHLNFMGITLWQDAPTFYMNNHVDNDRVKVAIQIYLDNRNSPGTWFEDREIRYGRNRGYILFNNTVTSHGVPDCTPHQGRLSIYALYD